MSARPREILAQLLVELYIANFLVYNIKFCLSVTRKTGTASFI